VELSKNWKGYQGVDMNEEQVKHADSDIANVNVAVDKAMAKLQVFLDGHQAVPAVKHIAEEQIRVLVMNHVMAMGMANMMDPELGQTLSVAFMTTFLAGIEWGKSGRELVHFWAECDHPEHQARKN
jgi:hypothetical protein